jgi:hypothetical protein
MPRPGLYPSVGCQLRFDRANELLNGWNDATKTVRCLAVDVQPYKILPMSAVWA